MLTDPKNSYITKLRKIANAKLRGAHGSSDARHFAKVNCSGIEFGLIGDGIGSDDEWVNIKSLERYYEVIKTFLWKIQN